MDTIEDPLIAHRRRQAEKNDREQRLRELRAAGPVVVVPSPMDVALGYRFIVPDEGVLPRNCRMLRNGLRRAGWWAYVNMVAAVTPPRPATEKVAAKPSELVYSYGVHGFSSYPPGDGDAGVVAYWTGEKGSFAWATRADYRDGVYYRTPLRWPDLAVLLRGMTG